MVTNKYKYEVTQGHEIYHDTLTCVVTSHSFRYIIFIYVYYTYRDYVVYRDNSTRESAHINHLISGSIFAQVASLSSQKMLTFD